MKLLCKNILLIVLLLGVAGVQVHANSIGPKSKTEFTKTIKKNFNISSDGDVSLSNKYGDINLKTWNKNEVNIEVTITVKSRSESDANEVFDRINIDFSNGSSYAKAETQIESQKSSWWSNNGSKGDFRIDYEVSMPKGASLDLRNKYGNSEMEAIGGDANIEVKYGNFNLESVGEDTKIILGYGNGTVGKINSSEVEIKYSKIKIKETDQINLDSKYSKIYIDAAEKIKSVSKYDNYDLGEIRELTNQGKYDHFEIKKVHNITAYSKYTDFDIDDLSGSASFELKYGGVNIDNLKDGFKAVSLECEYTDCKIYMEEGVDFQLDVIAEHASIRYPQGLDVSFEKDKNSIHEVKGHRGNTNAGLIKARLRYGGLKLR